MRSSLTRDAGTLLDERQASVQLGGRDVAGWVVVQPLLAGKPG
jgi:hypothetical protein